MNTRRILVVEDDPEVQGMLAKVLERCGHQVVSVGSAEDAVTALQRSAIDVIFTDLGLPTMSGYELMEHVRQNFPHIALVVVSGFPDPFHNLPPPDAFLPKPFPSLEAVRQAVDAALKTASR